MPNYIIKFIGSLLNLLSYIAPQYTYNLTLKLFSTPRKGKITEKQEKFLTTSTQKTFQYNNLNIHTYNWKGPKATILLIHGWESNSFRWKKLIKILHKQKYNIVTIDAPAHGKSGSKTFDAITYSEFINVVVNFYNPEILISHSIGGMASIFYQKKYQNNNLKKLVLLGVPSEFSNIFKDYTDLLGFNKRIIKGLNQLVINKFGNQPSYFSSAKFVKNIQTKGLIIHDEKDRIINYNDAKLIAANYSNSKLITTTGFGHGLKDKSINDKIVSFINQKDS